MLPLCGTLVQALHPGASVPSSSWTLVHADDALLVVEKDAGLLTVPGIGPEKQDCLLSRLRVAGYPELEHAPHRLDRDTSGLLVLGRTPAAHRALCMLFQARKVAKRYEALVLGWPAADSGEVDRPIGKIRISNGPARICVVDSDTNAEQVRQSLTRWSVMSRETLEDGTPFARVALVPVTGRAHQLRVHMESVGHPVRSRICTPRSGRQTLRVSRYTPSPHPHVARAVARRRAPRRRAGGSAGTAAVFARGGARL